MTAYKLHQNDRNPGSGRALEPVPIEKLLEFLASGVDAAHDRSDRDLLRLGNFSVTQTQLGKKGERCTDFRTQATQSFVESLPEVLLMQPPGRVVVESQIGNSVGGINKVLGAPSVAPAPPVQGRVSDDPQEPVTEPAATVKVL